jgi:aminopeptidase N
MSEGTATVISREDYTAPAFWIKTVDLTFDLDPGQNPVLNKMLLNRNPGHARRAPASGR